MFIFSIIFPSLISAVCRVTRIRKEIRNLSPNELNRYIRAVKLLASKPHPNELDKLTKVHLDSSRYIHKNSVFLPWHRYFLFKYEQELQKIDPSVIVPYWDWSIDSQAPERSEVLTERYLGGNGIRHHGGCVTGKFSLQQGYSVYYTNPNTYGTRCLKRSYDFGDKISPFMVPEAIEDLLKDGNFGSFSRRVEGAPHGAPHNGIGGDLRTMASPNDPLFWSHHAMVDKIWYDWQVRNPRAQQYDQNYHFPLSGLNAKVIDAFNLNGNGVCIKYDRSLSRFQKRATIQKPIVQNVTDTITNLDLLDAIINNKTLDSFLTNTQSKVEKLIVSLCENCPTFNDRSNLFKLRPTFAISNEWITSNGLDMNAFRRQELEYAVFIKNLNAKPGYQSKASLALRFPKK